MMADVDGEKPDKPEAEEATGKKEETPKAAEAEASRMPTRQPSPLEAQCEPAWDLIPYHLHSEFDEACQKASLSA